MPTIEWKYVYFSWNDDPEDLARAVDLAADAGVDRISFHVGGVVNAEDRSSLSLSDPFFTKIEARPIDDGVGVDLR